MHTIMLKRRRAGGRPGVAAACELGDGCTLLKRREDDEALPHVAWLLRSEELDVNAFEQELLHRARPVAIARTYIHINTVSQQLKPQHEPHVLETRARRRERGRQSHEPPRGSSVGARDPCTTHVDSAGMASSKTPKPGTVSSAEKQVSRDAGGMRPQGVRVTARGHSMRGAADRLPPLAARAGCRCVAK